MKKLTVCIVLSVAAVLLLIFVGLPQTAPKETGGDFYWERILPGYGRELERTDRRVVYYWAGHHGWHLFWTTPERIDQTRVACVRAWLDREMRSRSKGLSMRPHQLRLFHIWTGHTPPNAHEPAPGDAAHPPDPVDWWEAHRETFAPTEEQVQAFLAERHRLALLAQEIRERPTEALRQELGDELFGDLFNAQDVRFDSRSDAQIAAWRKGRPRLWQFLLEAAFFPALIFFTAYGVNGIGLRMRRRGFGPVSTQAAQLTVFAAAAALPFLLGYAPDTFSNAVDKGALLYDEALLALFLPCFLAGARNLGAMSRVMGEAAALGLALVATYALIGCVAGLLTMLGEATSRKRLSTE